jgi:hypothetical protein
LIAGFLLHRRRRGSLERKGPQDRDLWLEIVGSLHLLRSLRIAPLHFSFTFLEPIEALKTNEADERKGGDRGRYDRHGRGSRLWPTLRSASLSSWSISLWGDEGEKEKATEICGVTVAVALGQPYFGKERMGRQAWLQRVAYWYIFPPRRATISASCRFMSSSMSERKAKSRFLSSAFFTCFVRMRATSWYAKKWCSW